MTRPYLAVAAPMAAALVSVLMATGSATAAESSSPAAPPVSRCAAPAEGNVCELQELRSRSGYRLYTLSAVEAEQAKTIHGFIPTDEAKGIGMYETRVEGSIPVHRLRLAGDKPAYILVSSESELQKLRYDTSDPWDFKYEGVVGWVKRNKAPGTIALHRYSKQNEWRVARASRADLLNAGFKDDGLLGWAPSTAG